MLLLVHAILDILITVVSRRSHSVINALYKLEPSRTIPNCNLLIERKARIQYLSLSVPSVPQDALSAKSGKL